MEGAVWILTQLMQLDAGPQKFVADCFLLLEPEELKACRLVCTTWNKFIQKEVWENPRGRERLSGKLLHCWKTAHPLKKELGQVRQGVNSLFCDDRHIFCGENNGRVGVYKLSDCQWVTDLTPGMARPDNSTNLSLLAGSDGVLASVAWDSIGTVWSTTTMEQLHCFTSDSFHLLDASSSGRTTTISNVRVGDRSKIAILVAHSLHPGGPYVESLVVMKKVGSIWVNKILASFTHPFNPKHLYFAGDWLAFMPYSTYAEKKMVAWGREWPRNCPTRL